MLENCTIYPHKNGMSGAAAERLLLLVLDHNATTIVIGNGTACRETEIWLSTLIKQGHFTPYDIKFCIVNEAGSSVYSVSDEAEKELPGVDPNIRSAICIARRLQDPLLEYIKVDPKHLGIGMYQHDVPDVTLKGALESVMVECVSFVGVDLNVCPEAVLKKVSGLTAVNAANIVEWRQKNGAFVNRKQLLQVESLEPKIFEQCAGFVKIFPQTSCQNSSKEGIAVHRHNPLDTTIIHPESYPLAEQFLMELNAGLEEIGQPSLQAKVADYLKLTSVEDISKKLSVKSSQLKLVIEAFQKLQDFDIRANFDRPLFKTGVLSLGDVKVGEVLTARVTNVTSFGAFVDVGVGQDGLIHFSQTNGLAVHLGNCVSTRVLSVDVAKKYINLSLVSCAI